MILALYLAFLAAACAYASLDWRRGWLIVALCGVIQDPIRKLTPGTPVMVSFAVVGLFAAIVISARFEVMAHGRDFTHRFPNLHATFFLFLLMLVVAAFNGLFTYGFDKWKVPLLSLATYVAPLLAILFGYTWLQREEMLYRFFRWYAVLTSVAMVGSLLEYFRFQLPGIGLVAFEGDYIRHLPGIQIRMLSGFYRSPDIMAWHAATLTVIGIILAIRYGLGRNALVWSSVAAWGFLNCMIAGRRKAIYYIAVFCLVFLWRYFRRVKSAQILALIGLTLMLALVLRNIAAGEETNVYARGALTTQTEIAQRLEGGLIETFRQFGLLGAGLGTATQGVRHLLGDNVAPGWQEGGLGKLGIEVGLPGLIVLLGLAIILAKLLLRLTAIGDVEGSTQFTRAALFALAAANAANFMASAQAYTDAVLALTTGFLVGCLFATATLDERLKDSAARTAAPQQLTSPAPA